MDYSLTCAVLHFPDMVQNRKHSLEQMHRCDERRSKALLSWHWFCPTLTPFWDQKLCHAEFALEGVTCHIYLCTTMPSVDWANGLIHGTLLAQFPMKHSQMTHEVQWQVLWCNQYWTHKKVNSSSTFRWAIIPGRSWCSASLTLRTRSVGRRKLCAMIM